MHGVSNKPEWVSCVSHKKEFGGKNHSFPHFLMCFIFFRLVLSYMANIAN